MKSQLNNKIMCFCSIFQQIKTTISHMQVKEPSSNQFLKYVHKLLLLGIEKWYERSILITFKCMLYPSLESIPTQLLLNGFNFNFFCFQENKLIDQLDWCSKCFFCTSSTVEPSYCTKLSLSKSICN